MIIESQEFESVNGAEKCNKEIGLKINSTEEMRE